jgi:hypothetical protein
MKSLNCQQCGGVMIRKTLSSGNCLGLCIALVMFAAGVWLCFTGIGIIIGIPLCLAALFIGGKRKKVWRCKACKSVIDRG